MKKSRTAELRDLREELGYTQLQAAKACGINVRAYIDYEDLRKDSDRVPLGVLGALRQELKRVNSPESKLVEYVHDLEKTRKDLDEAIKRIDKIIEHVLKN